MEAWGMTHTGAVRGENQDAFAVERLPDGALFGVVCDGMGGAQAGDVASRLAVSVFMEIIASAAAAQTEPVEAMRDAIARANTAVFDHARKHPDCYGMGTTLVSFLMTEKNVAIANVGDSRAYHVTEAGIARITKDHSVVEDLVQRGELTPEQARQHPQKNLITRALGAEETVECDLYTIHARPDEFLLLCSDGLVNTLLDQEILYEIAHGGPPEECCARLMEIALSRGAPDNVTTVLVRF